MGNAFQKAAAKAKSEDANGATKTKKVKNITEVTDPEIATAIKEFVDADKREKLAKSDKEMAKGQVLPYCTDEWIEKFAGDGKQPETMKFRAEEATVSFIVSDKGEAYKLSDEQKETLTQLLGEDKVEGLVREVMDFKFNSSILEKEGVMDAVGEALDGLVKQGKMSQADCDALIEAVPKTTVRKGIPEDLAKLCDNDPVLMAQVSEALGSHMVTYVRVS